MLKILRSAFAVARREGLTDDNTAERVAVLKKKKKEGDTERRPFTLLELKKVMEVADEEWRGMILFGFYTGQRLGDISILTRKNLNLKLEEIKLTTDKTGRVQILPLPAPLLKYFKKLRMGDDLNTPCFPVRIKSCKSRAAPGI
jgi:integrase